MIDIAGLDKAKLLAALYNVSHPGGMGFLSYDPKPMSEEEAREILKTHSSFDYLKGRVMKIEISGDELDERLFDRDNGPGAALIAVLEVRNGNINSENIQKLHAVETAIAAIDADGMAETESSWDKNSNTFTLGADELGPRLKEKAREAFEHVTKKIKGE